MKKATLITGEMRGTLWGEGIVHGEDGDWWVDEIEWRVGVIEIEGEDMYYIHENGAGSPMRLDEIWILSGTFEAAFEWNNDGDGIYGSLSTGENT